MNLIKIVLIGLALWNAVLTMMVVQAFRRFWQARVRTGLDLPPFRPLTSERIHGRIHWFGVKKFLGWWRS